MHALKIPFSLLVLLVCFWMAPVFAADIAAGEQKAATCMGCHGPQGKSKSPQWPNLAAQQASYIVSQLHAFKSGTRNNPMMQSVAANLSDDDINNLAAYYSRQPAVSAGGDAALAKSGQTKASMCLGCHGASAEGNGQFPRLAGQHPDYLVKQLNSFKEKVRQNGHMQAIANMLSEDDMKALAAYFGSL
ncbi:c-type cytochrome [Methylobacter psychrophilus]|uniref:c-type cytochrome n=1 Tax=Methylobacter psychrophilus TaxID=96941 RepID=UPI0021D4C33D|nr:cytochrome c [Methylobacter psychrophilus]